MLHRSFLRSCQYVSAFGRLKNPCRVLLRMASTRSDSTVTKSLNDKREYRLICLNNGLRALLISDLDGCDQTKFVEEEVDELSASESESEESAASESEAEDDGVDGAEESHEASGEKKSAAALCVGVGSFSDPDDIPGFAHFLEHMVFMGSEKYPDENAFDDYISRHGGESNAWTDHERTCFYFDVERNHFSKALDKFAQFFAAPLLGQDSVDREIEAVDSEFQERLNSDSDRLIMLMASTAKDGNPMGKFLLGNAETLKKGPASRGEDIYGRLRDFYHRMYSAHYMTLAVQSKHTLDKLEELVRESFSSVPNNKLEKPSFSSYKEPFDTEAFRKFYKVKPVEAGNILIITWPFPPLKQHYRIKPLDYISTLMTYDGKGGIFSYLNKRTWALEVWGGNSGEGFDDNSTWSMLDLHIKLTDEGLQRLDDVIAAVFQYIHMLQQAGPSQTFYQEMKDIEDSVFRWKEQGNPVDYLERVSENMQNFPPEDILTGHRLWYQFDYQLIGQCLENLTATNCNITLQSSKLTSAELPEKEPWFGTKYAVSDLDPVLVAKLPVRNNVMTRKHCESVQDEFHMPHPNEFIATEFDLRKTSDADVTSSPKVVLETPYCRLHYKKDNKYNVPKGHANFHMMSPVINADLNSAVLVDLFVEIMIHNLTEACYPAELAGYGIGVSLNNYRTGIVIKIDGFNHKLHAVLKTVFDHVCNFTCDPALFEACRANLKKSYYNCIIQPYTAASMVRYSIIDSVNWSYSDKLQLVDSVTRVDLEELVQRFLSYVFVDSLVVGNITKEEAMSMCDSVVSQLTGSPVPQELLQQVHLYQLPQQKTYCQVPSFNPDDYNSCVLNYYQSGPGSLRTFCLNTVLTSRMREPCFNTLRTKKQLGYSVFSTSYLTLGVLGLGIIVECQADKFSMGHVDEQVDSFLVEMNEILCNMTQEEFQNLIESVVTLKKIEDTHMAKEVRRLFHEILEQTFLFDRREREISIINNLTLDELREWFLQYFGPQQRKLSVQVVGRKDGEVTEEDTSNVKKQKLEADYAARCLEDPDQQAVAVTDISAFRKTLKPLPFTKLTS